MILRIEMADPLVTGPSGEVAVGYRFWIDGEEVDVEWSTTTYRGTTFRMEVKLP